MEEQKRHLHIAVLTQGYVRWEQSNFFHHMLLDEELRKKVEFSLRYYLGIGMEGRPVSSNRNRIVRDRPEGSDLMMFDADVVPHPRIFEIAMDSEKDIVICPTPIWRPSDPGDCPVRVNMNAASDNKVMVLGADTYDEVLQGGTGAIYISNRVLSHPKMRAPFKFIADKDGVGIRGEDYSFCDRAIAAGFKIWSATFALCGHYHELNLLTAMRRWYEMMDGLGGGLPDDEG